MKNFLFFALSLLLLSSCVSTEKITYLQRPEGTPDTAVYQLQRSKYRVQPNDILNITVRSFDEETSALFNSAEGRATNMNAGDLVFYLTGYTIDMDGFIEMPVVGKLQVTGKNTEEIKQQIQTALNTYFKKDAVHISVQLAGVRYSVVGDVGRPGKYVIYQNQVNIFEALAQAGDITIVGDRREVEIIRQNPDGVKIISLDLTKAEVLSNPYFFIQPNDVINVKPLLVKSLGIGTTGFQTFASILGVLASTATLIFTLDRITRE